VRRKGGKVPQAFPREDKSYASPEGGEDEVASFETKEGEAVEKKKRHIPHLSPKYDVVKGL